MRCFNSSCCGKEVLLATIKDSVETLSEFPATNTRNSIFCRQNNWNFWLANHRTSCRTSGAIQPKSEKLRYRTDNCYWVRPKANGERSIVTMGYSYYTMLHFISLWSVIWSVLVILIKTMGKVHSSNTVKLNVWCFFTETVNTRQLFYKKNKNYATWASRPPAENSWWTTLSISITRFLISCNVPFGKVRYLNTRKCPGRDETSYSTSRLKFTLRGAPNVY